MATFYYFDHSKLEIMRYPRFSWVLPEQMFHGVHWCVVQGCVVCVGITVARVGLQVSSEFHTPLEDLAHKDAAYVND